MWFPLTLLTPSSHDFFLLPTPQPCLRQPLTAGMALSPAPSQTRSGFSVTNPGDPTSLCVLLPDFLPAGESHKTRIGSIIYSSLVISEGTSQPLRYFYNHSPADSPATSLPAPILTLASPRLPVPAPYPPPLGLWPCHQNAHKRDVGYVLIYFKIALPPHSSTLFPSYFKRRLVFTPTVGYHLPPVKMATIKKKKKKKQ